MIPQEKAIELLTKYRRHLPINTVTDLETKGCALMAVNEIILSNPHSNPFNTDVYSTMDYWLEVKEELEKL